MASLGLQRVGVGSKQDQSGIVDIVKQASAYADGAQNAKDYLARESNQEFDEEAAIIQEVMQFVNELEKTKARLGEVIIRSAAQKTEIDASITELDSLRDEALQSVIERGFKGVNLKSLGLSEGSGTTLLSKTGQGKVSADVQSKQKELVSRLVESPNSPEDTRPHFLECGEPRILADQLLELESVRARIERLREFMGHLPPNGPHGEVGSVSYS